MPVEPGLGAGARHSGPAQPGAQLSHPQLLQPAHGLVQPVVFKVKPLADAKRWGVFGELVQRQLGECRPRAAGPYRSAGSTTTPPPRSGGWWPARRAAIPGLSQQSGDRACITLKETAHSLVSPTRPGPDCSGRSRMIWPARNLNWCLAWPGAIARTMRYSQAAQTGYLGGPLCTRRPGLSLSVSLISKHERPFEERRRSHGRRPAPNVIVFYIWIGEFRPTLYWLPARN